MPKLQCLGVWQVGVVGLRPATVGEEGGCRCVIKQLAHAEDDLRGQAGHGVLELSVQRKQHQLEGNLAVGHVLDLVIESYDAVSSLVHL
eukprot:778102-Rhodomonas_salina.2